jgi:nucleoside 2-deoxyribosyltransferase
MTIIRKIYLGGPEVFLPDAADVVQKKAAMCGEFGFAAQVPQDTHGQDWGKMTPVAISRAIYQANVDVMKTCDCGLFDLTPFRGPSADVGTAFEVGLMTGMGKPVFAYTNVAGDFIDRFGLKQQKPNTNAMIAWTDERNWRIENFGNADNMMLDSAIALNGALMTRAAAPFPDLLYFMDGFRTCLAQAQAFLPTEQVKPGVPPVPSLRL